MQAIGFDFDHTLGIDNKLERTVALAVLQERAASNGAALDEPAALHAIDDALHAYRSGKATFDVAWASVCATVLGPDEETESFVVDFRDRALLAVPAHVEALPGAAELLGALQAQGIRYALLTNGWSPLQEAKAEAIGFEGPVLVSERIGARKPDARAFDVLLKALGVPAAEAAYVGDDPLADVCGANDAGLVSVWFDWEGIAYPDGVAAPDHVVHALGDVLGLVKGHQA